MSRIMLCSDLHLGHRNIIQWRTDFATVPEHDNHIIEQLKRTVNKRDSLWILGDVAFEKETLLRLNEIKCQSKVLILGNHDFDSLKITDHMAVFDRFYSLKAHTAYQRSMWFSHCPIHESEMRGKQFNIHGHTHNVNVDNPRYINVCVEHTNYGAVSLESLVKDR